MEQVNWLDRHIKFNKYETPELAKSFLNRELLRVSFIIPSGKNKLFNELRGFTK